MVSSGVLIVIGSGPGIGVSTASLFAQRHFSTIALLSRSEERLQNDKTTVIEAAKKAGKNDVNVHTIPVDISKLDDLRAALQKVEGFGGVECVFFNAARVVPSTMLETPVEEIELDFRISNLALYETARWAMPMLQRASPSALPSLVVTNSLLYKDPVPAVFSLSLTKAAQRSMVLQLNSVFGKDVHIALVSVGGPVSPEKPWLSPEYIATKIVELYEQPREKWEIEIEILDK